MRQLLFPVGLLLLILSTLLALNASAAAAGVRTSTSPLVGDLDRDGDVDQRDLQLLMLSGGAEAARTDADAAHRTAMLQLQATAIAFDGQPPAQLTEGDAPSIGFVLNGLLLEGMYVRVEAWDEQTQRPHPDFSHVIVGEPDADGRYVVDASRLAALPAGGYLLQVSLHRLQGAQEATLDLADHWVYIGPASVEPEPQPVQAASRTETSPATTPSDTSVASTAASGGKRVVWNFKPSSGMTYRNLVIKGGVRVVWESIHDVTFVDCDFEDAEIHLVVQSRDNGSAASRNWTFVRCTFMGATRRDWGHSHGAYLQGVDDFTFRDCLFKYNGWLNGQRFNQNHHVYLVDVGNVRFLRCSFRRAAAQGIKALGFERLVVRDCEFRGNLIDIAGDDRSRGGIVAIKDSSFYNTGGYDSSNLALGWSVHFEYDQHELDRVVVRDCTWVGPGVPNNTVAIKLAGRIHRARIIRPDLRRWAAEADDQAKIKNQIGNRLSIIKGLGLN